MVYYENDKIHGKGVFKFANWDAHEGIMKMVNIRLQMEMSMRGFLEKTLEMESALLSL